MRKKHGSGPDRNGRGEAGHDPLRHQSPDLGRPAHLAGVRESIGRAALENLDFTGVVRALMKTRNSEWWSRGEKEFQRRFVSLEEGGAEYLLERGVKLVGVDYLSIERYGSPDHKTHHALLRRDVVIVEGLDLSAVPPGDYDLFALPMRIKGADGSPARVVLRTRDA